MGMTEKIKIVMVKRKTNAKQLSEMLGYSTGNISHKFKRDNFTERDLIEIADALGCDVEVNLIIRETGEKV